jgi:hypothetical protein
VKFRLARSMMTGMIALILTGLLRVLRTLKGAQTRVHAAAR